MPDRQLRHCYLAFQLFHLTRVQQFNVIESTEARTRDKIGDATDCPITPNTKRRIDAPLFADHKITGLGRLSHLS